MAPAQGWHAQIEKCTKFFRVFFGGCLCNKLNHFGHQWKQTSPLHFIKRYVSGIEPGSSINQSDALPTSHVGSWRAKCQKGKTRSTSTHWNKKEGDATIAESVCLYLGKSRFLVYCPVLYWIKLGYPVLYYDFSKKPIYSIPLCLWYALIRTWCFSIHDMIGVSSDVYSPY